MSNIQTIPLHDQAYKQCSRCLMDTTTKEIKFDAGGICNFCSEFLSRNSNLLSESGPEKKIRLERLVAEIKSQSYRKKYDCIVGVSGGVDSSWTLVKAVELGLRPLAVHMDNGWNSELAQNNIEQLVRRLGVDLYTHVIDWIEYRRLMEAFFDADVINIELLYDNAMIAVNYQQARKHGVKTILAGTNQATEGIRMPSDWNWFNYDRKNILAIAQKSSIQKFTTFPSIGVNEFLLSRFLYRIKWVSFLDFTHYVKAEVLEDLTKNFGYKPYSHKHYESVFTRFYQGYILPKKFNVDKRKLHFSNLIVTGQISRSEGLSFLKGHAYESLKDLNHDVSYFLKKMDWDAEQLDEYLARKEKSHSGFANEKMKWDKIMRVWHSLSPNIKANIKRF